MIFGLDFRMANRGGAVSPGRLLPLSGLPTRSLDELRRATRVVFCLHGYNVSRPQGQRALADFAQHLHLQGDAALVAVTWPGDSWARFASYPFEGRDADDSAAALARFITDELRPDTELAFVSHSLGARVALETVDRLPPGRYAIGQICLMAPAVDNDSLADPAVYRAATERSARTAVLSSTNDTVLRVAYPLGDTLQRFLYVGERTGPALGYRGPVAHRNQGLPRQVLHYAIKNGPKPGGYRWSVGHVDYLPSTAPTREQRSAAAYADAALAGVERPPYPY